MEDTVASSWGGIRAADGASGRLGERGDFDFGLGGGPGQGCDGAGRGAGTPLRRPPASTTGVCAVAAARRACLPVTWPGGCHTLSAGAQRIGTPTSQDTCLVPGQPPQPSACPRLLALRTLHLVSAHPGLPAQPGGPRPASWSLRPVVHPSTVGLPRPTPCSQNPLLRSSCPRPHRPRQVSLVIGGPPRASVGPDEGWVDPEVSGALSAGGRFLCPRSGRWREGNVSKIVKILSDRLGWLVREEPEPASP